MKRAKRRQLKAESGRANRTAPNPAVLARPNTIAALLAIALFFVYVGDGGVLAGNDAKPTVYLAMQLLERGRFSFTPEDHPFMFVRQEGQAAQPMYYLTPSVRDGRYVSLYGPGAAVTALPAFALARLTLKDWKAPAYAWTAAKCAAAALTALSAALVFLISLTFLRTPAALAVAVAYGLGTCVFSVSSQTLWQHPSNHFFIALGTFFLVRLNGSVRRAAGCGLSFAAAIACRPTSALVFVAVAGYLAWRHRDALFGYLTGALGPIALLAIYNTWFMGAPWAFGQPASGAVALAKTGSADVWGGSLLGGSAGLLFSPSRGLFVYSPFLLFAIPGLVRVWRQDEWAALRPLTVACAGLLTVQSLWFDWWGGWSWGYRQLVDLAPMLVLFLIPVVHTILARRALAACAALLLAFSVGVQVLGAWSFDLVGWNYRVAYPVQMPGNAPPRLAMDIDEATGLERAGGRRLPEVRLDIDDMKYRYRLWSWADSPLVYYVTHLREAHTQRKAVTETFVSQP